MRFGAVSFLRGIVRCGSVRFSYFKIIRCGAVCLFTVRCGAVRCGTDLVFQESTVRCGAVRLSVQQLSPTVRLSVHRSKKDGVYRRFTP